MSSSPALVPWLLSLGMFVIGTTSLSILGVGPAVTRELGVAPSAAGWLVTAFAATFAVAAPASQFTLGRRFAPRTLIVGGAALLAASLVWAALATGFTSLLASRVLSALGGALIAPTSAALAIALVPPERRGATLAVVFTGFTLATVAGVPLMTWLALGLGWRGAMAAIAGAAVVLLVLVVAFLPRRVDVAPRPPAAESGPVRGRTALLLGTTLGVLAAQFTVYALMGEMLGERFGVTDAALPGAILLFGLLGVAGNTAAGMLSDRLGAPVLVWVGLGMLAGLFLVLSFELGPLLGSAALAGCAFAGTLFATPQQSRLVALVPPERHALVLALNSSVSYLGIAVGSGLASGVATTVGLGVLPLAALGLVAVTAALNGLVRAVPRPVRTG